MHRRKDIVTWKRFAMNRNLPQVEQASISTNSSSLRMPSDMRSITTLSGSEHLRYCIPLASVRRHSPVP
ncbi:hypothetical protein QC762_0064300 [Podospora pseudocomata]|uniref:Uncharacterized protein n=1 Tax=Podospora pseudocomata TaxID=2093779 RepID=A0ABR0GF97_9PEZI|nr:hypothetical protein QC762_0064300 [Podospora pseudocomata]